MKKTQRIIALVLIVTLVVSLGAGLGAFLAPVEQLTVEAKSGGIIDNKGIYTITDNAAKAVGTAENPFTVLEIVPDASMAQFGYLVGGQEPIDVSAALVTAASSSAIINNLSYYLTASVDRSASPAAIEFVSDITEEQWNDANLHWGLVHAAPQFGEYTLNSENKGNWDPIFNTGGWVYPVENGAYYRHYGDWTEEGAEPDSVMYSREEVYLTREEYEAVKDQPEYVRIDDLYYDRPIVNAAKSYDLYEYAGANAGDYSKVLKKTDGGNITFFEQYQYTKHASDGNINIHSISNPKWWEILNYWSHDNGATWNREAYYVTFKKPDTYPEGEQRYEAKIIASPTVYYSKDGKVEFLYRFKADKNRYSYAGSDSSNGYAIIFVPSDDPEKALYIVENESETPGDLSQSRYGYTYTKEWTKNIIRRTAIASDTNRYQEGFYEIPEYVGGIQYNDNSDTYWLGDWNKKYTNQPISDPSGEVLYKENSSEIQAILNTYSDTAKYVLDIHYDYEVEDDIQPIEDGRYVRVWKYTEDHEGTWFRPLLHDIAEKDAEGSYTGNEDWEYTLTGFVESRGTGAYDLVSFNYAECSAKDAADYDNTANSFKVKKIPDDSEAGYHLSDYNELVKWTVNQQLDVYHAYAGTKASKEWFKKYAIGLMYKENDYTKGIDSDHYEFLGWYTDPNGVNIFNEGSPITSEITVYGKWLTFVSADGSADDIYTVSFDKNLPEEMKEKDEATVLTGFTFNEALKFNSGTKLSEPECTPALLGYKFIGWYVDEECTEKYVFNKKLTVPETTVYAGWQPVVSGAAFNVYFDANMGPGVVDESLSGMIGPVTLQENGYQAEYLQNVATLAGTPTRDNYTFAGWYLDRDCAIAYDDSVIAYLVERNDTEFLKPVPESETDKYITLYASWIRTSNLPQYTVTINANKPSGATGSIENVPESKVVTRGDTLPSGHLKTLALDGNVNSKLADYHVQVITVTPEDLDKTDGSRSNQNLIDQADLIVFSQNYDETLVDYFKKYRNKTLFSKSNSAYASTEPKTTFVQNDISNATLLHIFKRIAGADGAKICPVVYDYSIYKEALTSGKYAGSIETTAKFNGDDAAGNVPLKDGVGTDASDNNVYKLYLLTQQMNPVTLYNAYTKKTSSLNFGASGKVEFNGYRTSIGNADAKTYWNRYTLIPYAIVTKDAWVNSQLKNSIGVIGVTLDPELKDANYSIVHNRMLIYNGTGDSSHVGLVTESAGGSGIAGRFTSVSKLIGTDNPELNEYLNGDSSSTYRVGEALYYLIHDKSVNANYSENISVLEIEPSDSFQSDDYWFWYVSRYVPNFTGNAVPTKTTTWEFIGSEGNINSKYDVVYIGADTSGFNQYYLNTLMAKAESEKTIYRAAYVGNRGYEVQRSQVLKGFERYEIVGSEYKISNIKLDQYREIPAHYISLSHDESGNLKVTSENVEDEKLTIEVEGRTDSGLLDWWKYTIDDRQGTTYYRIDFKSNVMNALLGGGTVGAWIEDKITEAFIKFSENDSYNVIRKHDGLIIHQNQHGQYKVDKYYYYEGPVYGWVQYEEDTTVGEGDIIRPIGESMKVAIDNPNGIYAYSHSGRTDSPNKVLGIIDLHGESRKGVFDEYDYVNHVKVTDGQDDNVLDFVYSGNDITAKKYEALINFVKAGYPVILSKNLLEGDEIDKNKIDTASYMYKFLSELKTTYSASCFVENDTTMDLSFIRALDNKSFEVTWNSSPVEYQESNTNSYLNEGVDGEDIPELKFEFTISSDTSHTYEFELFVDTNADGKFSPDEEEFSGIAEVYNETKRQHATAHGLSKGNRYSVVINIEDTVGAVPWKIVIKDSSNKLVTEERTGVSAIRLRPGQEKQVLNVLQIKSNSDNVLTLPSRDNTATDSVTNLFRSKTSSLKEFDIEFFVLTVDQFKSIVNNKGYEHRLGNVYVNEEGRLKCIKTDATALDDVNMIILGFGNYYSGFDDKSAESKNALQFIENFINEGKATLFTHDTTSFWNLDSKPAVIGVSLVDGINPNIQHYWGYSINEYFRSTLGMDRYDVMYNRGRTTTSVLEHAHDWPFISGEDPFKEDGSVDLTKVETRLTDKVKIGTNGRVVLSQGVTPWFLYETKFGRTLMTEYIKSSKYTANKATQANVGQITVYPYQITNGIGDKIDIAMTHGQYYQLDLETDDIVVWYTLYSTDDSANQNIFKLQNDVRNNYYIYSRGNVTYTGMGHSGGLSESEVELFVNTMVASYRASAKAAHPEITNSDKSAVSDELDYLYVDYDTTVDPDDLIAFGDEIMDFSYQVEYYDPATGSVATRTEAGKAKRVYFDIKDTSIAARKQLSLQYYPTYRVASNDVRVFAEYQLNLETYGSLNGAAATPAAVSTDFRYQYRNKSGLKYIIRNADEVKTVHGYTVKTKPEYYVDIPINDSYYDSLYYINGDGKRVYLTRNGRIAATGTLGFPESMVADYSELEAELGDTLASAGFGLDSLNKVEIQMQVITRFADNDPDNCQTGYKNVILVKRGMFTLD